MALEKATKTVLLAAGMRQDADPFLMDSPALAYVENGVFDRAGVVSKRRGFDDLGSFEGASAADGTPGFLHALGDSLVTISNAGVHAYREGSGWGTVSWPTPLYGMEQTFATEPERDVGEYTDVLLPDGTRVCVWDKATGPSDYGLGIEPPVETPRGVQVRVYDPNGLVRHEVLLDGVGRQAKVVLSDLEGLVYITYVQTVDDTPDTHNLVAVLFNTVTGDAGAPFDLQTEDLDPTPNPRHAVNPGYIGMEGFSFYWTLSTAPNGEHVIAYAARGAAGALTYLRRYDAAFSELMPPKVYGTDIANHGAWPLAVLAEDEDHYLLYADRYEGLPVDTSELSEGNVVLLKLDRGNVTTLWSQVLRTASAVNVFLAGVKGTLALSDGVLFYAFHEEYQDGVSGNTGNRETALRWGRKNAGTGTAVGTEESTLHHTLTTNAAFLDDAFVFGVQQYFDATPPLVVRPTPPDPDELGPYVVQRAISQLTTLLCRADFELERLIPFATLDAGRSRHHVSTVAMRTAYLCALRVDGTSLVAVNRESVTAEDPTVTASAWLEEDPIELTTGIFATTRAGEACFNTYLLERTADVPVVALGDGLLIGGAISLWYDGATVREAFPLETPEIIGGYEPYSGFVIVADNGSIAFAVSGFFDAMGNAHRSPPGASVLADTTSPLQDVRITTPLSVALDPHLYAEVFATNTDSTGEPRLSGSRPLSVLRDTNFDGVAVMRSGEVTLPSTGTVTTPRSGAFAYTAGGVLAADPWPALKSAIVASNRVWGISAEDRGTVFVSKLFEEFVAPEFSASLVISLGDERDLMALGRLDDKTVVFEKDEIHVIYGEGPDNAGSGQNWAVHHVTSDVGCIDAKSVVETPRGLAFLSRRGFHLLGRDLSVTYIGGPIETMAEHVLVDAATIVPAEGEVRWAVRQDPDYAAPQLLGPDPGDPSLLPDIPPRPKFTDVLPTDACLVWNYERDAWSVFSNYASSAMCLFRGRLARLRSDWSVWHESLDSWRDPEGENRMHLITPWIKFGQIQDFARLLRLTFLGRYLSSFRVLEGEWGDDAPVLEAGDIRVTLTYDYEEPTEDVPYLSRQNYTRATFRANEDFSREPRYALPVPTDARAQRLQFRVTPHRQKVQAVQIRLDEADTMTNGGETDTFALGRGWEISSVDLEYGLKGGSSRTLSERRKR